MKKYVTYFRVSTKAQGESGLGLDGQKKAVTDYLAGQPHAIVGEFTEVESGRKSKRPELDAALKCCRKHNASLVVARTDRLSRNVHFLSGLMERKVEFVAVDNPSASNLSLHIMCAVAEEEARLCSLRVRAALAAAKERGVELGKHGKILAKENKAKANNFAKTIASTMGEVAAECIKESGKVSYRAMANLFNKKKIKTPRGGKWHGVTIKNYCDRLNINVGRS